MARILSIDFGLKRCGLAATDPMQIIVSGLETVPSETLLDWLANYLSNEQVEKIVIGHPTHADGSDTYLVDNINILKKEIRKIAPEMEIDMQDESFTSSMAKSLILQSGVKKKKRRDKSLVDKMSAVIILQRYLNHI